MIDWLEYGKTAIFRDTSKGGLLSQFLNEYSNKFGGTINPSCQKCLNSYWNNYLKSFQDMETNNCDYELHKKYEGIQLGFNERPIRNTTLTNEIAERLLKNHPSGAQLFAKIPKIEVKKEEIIEEKEVKKPIKRTRKSKK